MVSIIGATHPGRREHNEDCFIANSAEGVGLVADGMGGYACGEVASGIVKQTVEEAVSNNEGLREAIARAHAVVREAATADKAKRGMGSTAIAFKLQGLDYELAWVGDSRAYLWLPDKGELRQISRDHSYVETLVTSGAISHDEAVVHPNKNLITQAVGVAGENGLEIEVIQGRLSANQQLMICSDGLVDEVPDLEIARLLSVADNPEQALRSLISAALEAGGHDNITIVLASNDHSTDKSGHAFEPPPVRATFLPDGGAPSRRERLAEQVSGAGHQAVGKRSDGAVSSTLLAQITDFVEQNLSWLLSALALVSVVVFGLLYLS